MDETSLRESLPWDWYIQIKLPFSPPLSVDAPLVEEYARQVEQFHQDIESTIHPSDSALHPTLLTSTSEPGLLIRLIGIPTLPSPAISTCRKLSREWARNPDISEKLGNRLEVKFISRNLCVSLMGSEWEEYVDPGESESVKIGDSNDHNDENEMDDSQQPKNFTKIKGSNPQQVRHQFRAHQMKELARLKQKPTASSSSSSVTPQTKPKTAKQILVQLRYDPHLQMDEFLVGYIDRQEGIIERSVSNWFGIGTAQAMLGKEELIAYVRNSRTEEMIWVREAKGDMMSGG